MATDDAPPSSALRIIACLAKFIAAGVAVNTLTGHRRNELVRCSRCLVGGNARAAHLHMPKKGLISFGGCIDRSTTVRGRNHGQRWYDCWLV